MNVADPRRIVLITTRPSIRRTTRRRRPISLLVIASPDPVRPSLGQLADQIEDRQVHYDDDAADYDAEGGDHDPVAQRHQGGGPRVRLLLLQSSPPCAHPLRSSPTPRPPPRPLP